jgi:hypothetical protein
MGEAKLISRSDLDYQHTPQSKQCDLFGQEITAPNSVTRAAGGDDAEELGLVESELGIGNHLTLPMTRSSAT